jgi:hypothetical protein
VSRPEVGSIVQGTAALAEGPAVLCTVMAELRLGSQKRESTSTQSDREATSEPE